MHAEIPKKNKSNKKLNPKAMRNKKINKKNNRDIGKPESTWLDGDSNLNLSVNIFHIKRFSGQIEDKDSQTEFFKIFSTIFL